MRYYICIEQLPGFTVGKKYTVENNGILDGRGFDELIYADDPDDCRNFDWIKDFFISLSEYRKKKLERILK